MVSDTQINLERGQAMMVATILFLVVSVTIIFGLAGPILKQQRIASNLVLSRQGYFLAEAGLEDVVYRLKTGKPVSSTEVLSLSGDTTTTVTTDVLDEKQIVSSANVRSVVRKLRTNVILGSGVSFHFGIQAGEGGLVMENTSSVSGNIYSNGAIRGTGPTNNVIRGSVVSAWSDGLVDNLYDTSSVYAHTINGAKVDGDAYYQSISNTTVLGTLYPGSSDQATSSLPIPDEQIEEWKQAALAGGVISSPSPHKNSDTITLGPVKINCDLEVSGNNYAITLAGNVWVEGDIIVKHSPIIRIDPSFDQKGVAIVADKPSAPNSSGKISLENSAVFEGSGSPGSYVMLVSQNRSAESGGNEVALNVQNTVSGALLVYAGHGEIDLQNSINLKEVSAYQIRLKNTAEVVYETGIANLLFDTGPSGSYEILSWEEIE